MTDQYVLDELTKIHELEVEKLDAINTKRDDQAEHASVLDGVIITLRDCMGRNDYLTAMIKQIRDHLPKESVVYALATTALGESCSSACDHMPRKQIRIDSGKLLDRWVCACGALWLHDVKPDDLDDLESISAEKL